MSYPQDEQYSNDDYDLTQERYISHAELRHRPESRGSIYVIPSIMSPHKWIVPQEGSLRSFASNTILFPPALQFTVPPSSSILSTQIVPTVTEFNERGEIRQDKNEDSIAKCQTYTRPEPQFRCECGATCGRRWDMVRHLTTSPKHGNEKRFKCGTCSRVFSREDSLKVMNFQMFANQIIET